MSSQTSDLGQDSYRTNQGGSPQHEARFYSSKRAREIQAEEGITSPYRSSPLPLPSLSTSGAFNSGTLLSDSNEFLKTVGSKPVGSPNGNSSEHLSPYAGGYRRARADTLPSSLPGGRQPFALGHHSSSSLSLSSLGASSSTSNLLSPPKASSRLRSGSLTLPSSSLSNAFGPSIFASGWSDRNENNGPPTPPAQTPTTGELLRGDDNNTVGKTLDYLGLDDHEIPTGGLSKISTSSNALPQIKVEMKTPTTPTYSGSLPPIPALRRDANRIRSYSVSATAKYDDQPAGPSSVPASNLFPPGNAAVQQFHQTHSRPRAISMSMLDLPNDVMSLRQNRGSSQLYTDASDQQVQSNAARPMSGEQLIGSMVNSIVDKKKQHQQVHEDDYGIDRSEVDVTRSGVSTPRALTPDQNQGAPPPQTPTRSLWIGNIDPSLTNQDLMQTFSRYGNIESLRLLPDKECGFVNFSRVEDAVTAKDDIMERLGGRVGNCIVRVGFGKADASYSSNDLSPSSQTQLQPTRALWVGNIPTSTTPQMLQNIFSPYGSIESARVLTHKNCGFVNFEKLEDAVKAKKALHGKEVLGSAVGAVRIGFAKVQVKPSPSATPEPGSPATRHIRNLSASSSSSNNQSNSQWTNQTDSYNHSNVVLSLMMNGANEKQLMMRELSGGSDEDIDEVADNRPPTNYFTSIPPVGDPNPNRRPDASRLREIRKRLDSGHCSAKEVESIANEVMEECVELSSDYIGNTVIQKLFERCSENTKLRMLEKIASHLATIGIHKNGTWAAQKIIDMAKTPAQMNLIVSNIKAYTPPLLLDQFGNYVVQCCLRLGSQRNQFIFDAMVDRCWEVAQGRFGARAIRACMESQHVTKKQQKQVVIAIVMNAVSLATNPNGALLLTWLLDSSSFPGRYRILAPKLAPHLNHLCTHKLASLTVLKLINQQQETDARDLMISSLFFSHNDQVLDDVLSDQVHGVGVVQKVLANTQIDQAYKQRLAEKVKLVLGKLKVQQVQGYKRLLEELGMVGDPSLNASPMNTVQPMGMNSQNVFTGTLPQDFAAAAAAYYAAAFTNQQLQQTVVTSPSSENASSSPHEHPLSPGATSPPPSEGSTSAGAVNNSSTPSSGAYPPPMLLNNVPMNTHPHTPFGPSPYPQMTPFAPFLPASAWAAVAAGMYGPPALFNAAAYPYIMAASGAIPPPVMNSGPPPQVNATPQMLAYFQQQNQQLVQQQQQTTAQSPPPADHQQAAQPSTQQPTQSQQAQQQVEEQLQTHAETSTTAGGDALAQSSPHSPMAEPLRVGQAEVLVQAQP